MAAPIEAWACVVWDALVEEAALHQAWKRQQIRLGLNPMWREVNGFAGSCVMVAKEKGWRRPAWHTFLSREGQRMDMRHTCPMDVVAMAKKDAEARTWYKWAQADEKRATLAPGPLLEPVERWFRRRKKGKGAMAAAQAVAAGLWTQAKSHSRGLAENPFCVACLKEGRDVRGDAKHRMTACNCFDEERRKLLPTWRHQAATSTDRWLWDRGLVKDPSKPYKCVQQDEDIRWHVAAGGEAMFTGMLLPTAA
jgi:hypothetical protein